MNNDEWQNLGIYTERDRHVRQSLDILNTLLSQSVKPDSERLLRRILRERMEARRHKTSLSG